MRKTAIAMLALLAPVLSSYPMAAMAQDAPPPAGPPGAPPYGAGADPGAKGGGASLAAYQARMRQRLMRMDTDRDGRISLAEWTAARAAHPGPGGGRGDPARMFQRLDADHDGYVTPEEIDAASARRFDRMDANHDGVLTPDEQAAGRHGYGGSPDGGEPAQPLSPG